MCFIHNMLERSGGLETAPPGQVLREEHAQLKARQELADRLETERGTVRNRNTAA